MASLDTYGRVLPLVGRPWHEAKPELQQLDAWVKQYEQTPVGRLSEVSSHLSTFRICAWDQGHVRTLALALAAKAYQHDHGTYPDTIGELRPYVGAELPRDPFTGQDYLYERRGQGFAISSADRGAAGRFIVTWEATK